MKKLFATCVHGVQVGMNMYKDFYGDNEEGGERQLIIITRLNI